MITGIPVSYLAEGEKISLKLPASNVVKMTWEDGSTLTVRPSGTEPKLKIYITAIDETREKALHGRNRKDKSRRYGFCQKF